MKRWSPLIVLSAVGCGPPPPMAQPPANEIQWLARGDSLRREAKEADLLTAIALYDSARSSAIQRADPLMEGVALGRVGQVRRLRGEYQIALDDLHHAADRFASIGHSNQTVALHAIAIIHWQLGAADSATTYLQRAVNLERARREPDQVLIDQLWRTLDSLEGPDRRP